MVGIAIQFKYKLYRMFIIAQLGLKYSFKKVKPYNEHFQGIFLYNYNMIWRIYGSYVMIKSENLNKINGNDILNNMEPLV